MPELMFLICSDGADEKQIAGCAELAGRKVWWGIALKHWQCSGLLVLIKATLSLQDGLHIDLCQRLFGVSKSVRP